MSYRTGFGRISQQPSYDLGLSGRREDHRWYTWLATGVATTLYSKIERAQFPSCTHSIGEEPFPSPCYRSKFPTIFSQPAFWFHKSLWSLWRKACVSFVSCCVSRFVSFAFTIPSSGDLIYPDIRRTCLSSFNFRRKAGVHDHPTKRQTYSSMQADDFNRFY